MPIQILPARLANQIAAGEVVERPASVVKELVENSLDSGATSIEIDIEKGGHKRILIRDNGSGIVHDELALALSRHATSKIAKLDDLEAICSLGFRGEALASISSVARLSLSSKPKEQTQAWQAHCEGRDMQVQLNPVAHPDGTSVDVVDLFFNTPARRKFLRTEKTEFAHIDEIVRRIALSRFDVSFSLKHNGKLLRKYPAVKVQGSELKRLANICGKEFSEQCIELNSQYQQFELKGWLAQPEQAKPHGDFQYFYVNGRMMRDKLINHAVRQAFEGLIGADLYPAYVLYLTLEPNQVDVNVHPAKHEVRFHQARLVHDFIYRALTDSLNQYFQQGQQHPPEVNVLPNAEPNHNYIQALQRPTSEPKVDDVLSSYGSASSQSSGSSGTFANKDKAEHLVNSSQVIKQSSKNYQQLMTPTQSINSAEQATTLPGQWLQVTDKKILIKVDKKFYLLETQALHLNVMSKIYADTMPVSQPLLMPISIKATADLLAQAKALYQPLLENSVEIGWTPNRIILRKVPAGLRQFRWIECLEDILSCTELDTKMVRKHLLTCMVSAEETDLSQIQELWQQFVHSSVNLEHDMAKIATPVNLDDWLNMHE
ncbi:DNA mismatch repair endonuclease MutL [Paraglaciecola arctica]|uniref:DNA mismatch repair protein MutL n=1 Tax=Paraglaciecola arctica BSs20135 TaxID=493475 RepID=K6Y4U6_9ALTE|nr:DNA mismatch repair endonuclease MutL [Paraglaciecola arctica]GAC18981.1 DNA mismatch repair protein MutL [Paraglaciecola arctica BSs20135]